MKAAACSTEPPVDIAPLVSPPTGKAILDALDDVRRRIRAHAGDIEVMSISEDGDVTLGFSGACAACPSQAMTIGAAVLPVVEKIQGVRTISIRGMTVSTAAMRRIRTMFA